MPRLDRHRLQTWNELQSVVSEIRRQIDDDLRREWAVPIVSFEVLAALRELGGRARPQDVAAAMRLPRSSVSRRLDRLEEEGWIARHRGLDADDGRAVDIELTPRGRTLWREMNVSYRRAVQYRFAGMLTDDEVDALAELAQRIDPTIDTDDVGDDPDGG